MKKFTVKIYHVKPDGSIDYLNTESIVAADFDVAYARARALYPDYNNLIHVQQLEGVAFLNDPYKMIDFYLRDMDGFISSQSPHEIEEEDYFLTQELSDPQREVYIMAETPDRDNFIKEFSACFDVIMFIKNLSDAIIFSDTPKIDFLGVLSLLKSGKWIGVYDGVTAYYLTKCPISNAGQLLTEPTGYIPIVKVNE